MSKMDVRRPVAVIRLCFAIWLVTLSNATFAYTLAGSVKSYNKDGYNITFNCEQARPHHAGYLSATGTQFTLCDVRLQNAEGQSCYQDNIYVQR